MKNDVCIKAGSYCPICKGVVLADCWHDSSQFYVPLRYQHMKFNAQLQNKVNGLQSEIAGLRAHLAVAVEALKKLSCLGNGDKPGNSIGNYMAQDALTTIKGDSNDRHR